MGTISSLRKPREGLHATVITYDSFRSRVEKGTLQPHDYDVVILDEAHKGLSDRRLAAIDQFREHALILGFTATPGYTKEKHLKEKLGPEIHRITLNEAVNMEMLCPISAYTYDTGVDLSAVRRNSTGTYEEDSLEGKLDFHALAEVAYEKYIENFNGMQGYIFCGGIKQAEATAEVFSSHGVSCAVVSEKTPQKERDRIWTDFTSGKIALLSNVDLFTQGTDYDAAEVSIHLSETESVVREQQRGGRVLRRLRSNPYKRGHILNFLYRDKRRKKTVTFAQIAETDPIELLRSGRAIEPQEVEPQQTPENDEATGLEEREEATTEIVLDGAGHAELIDQVNVDPTQDTVEITEPEEREQEELKPEDELPTLEQQINDTHEEVVDLITEVEEMRAILIRARENSFIEYLVSEEERFTIEGDADTAQMYRTDFDRMIDIIRLLDTTINTLYKSAEPVLVHVDINNAAALEKNLQSSLQLYKEFIEYKESAADLFEEAIDIGQFYEFDLLEDSV